jgi:hypothetical protein
LTPSVVDYQIAKECVQHFATKLRAGDALHLAVARNAAKTLYTLDGGLLRAIKLMKVHVSRGIKPRKVSISTYAVAIVVSFRLVWLAQLLYVVVALLWLISDRCIERWLHVDQFET